MFVIIASRRDRIASSLAGRWDPWEAKVLTCADLSVTGWRHQPHEPTGSTVVIGGQKIGEQAISGILTRIWHVPEHELTQIAREDRAYVASEMTAFLRSWLAGIGCPVLNLPTPTCLSGPGWSHERWVHTAARVGLPTRPARLGVEPPAGIVANDYTSPSVCVTVVGTRCVGDSDAGLRSQARILAKAAQVALLTVRFAKGLSGVHFHSADLWPDVSTPEVADAVLEYFLERERC